MLVYFSVSGGATLGTGARGGGGFVEASIDTPLDECIRHDPKGLYARALDTGIAIYTGLDSPYEIPDKPEIVIRTRDEMPNDAARRILQVLRERNVIR